MKKITRRAIIDCDKHRDIKIQLPDTVIDKLRNATGVETCRIHDCNNDFIITENVHVDLVDKNKTRGGERVYFNGDTNVIFIRNSSGITAVINLDGLTSKVRKEDYGTCIIKGNQVLIININNLKVVNMCDML